MDVQIDSRDKIDQDLLRIQQAVAAAGDVAYEWNLIDERVAWSGNMREFQSCGMADGETPAADFLRRLDPEDVINRRRALHSHITSGGPFDCEYRIRRDDGGIVWANERGLVEQGQDGKPVRLVGTMRIVTARKEVEARLVYESEHDAKTGLYNRTKLTDVLDDVISHNRAFDSHGIYITLGVDRISVVNDAFGHETGDMVLHEIAARLDTRPPLADVVGRVSGDTFGLVVAQCSEEQVVDLLNRILEDIRNHPVETPSGPLHVTASNGCATFPLENENAHDVMTKAELAMRQAKEAGRNTYFRYEETRDKAAADRELMAIADRVQRALNENRLLLAYQPIVRATSTEVVHYECLLRMIDEDGRISSAGAMMPAIEEIGLIDRIDMLVLNLAAKELRDNPDISLALNVSGATTSDAAWLNQMVKIARDYPDLPRRMLVEITETAVMDDINVAADFVSALRDLGCNVALDDFGAGYTTFRNLRALPINVVKIDGSFVKKVALERDNQIFVEALVTLARGFELETVAECVETSHDASVLTAFGVDFLQGYYFGKPDIKRPWRAKTPARAGS